MNLLAYLFIQHDGLCATVLFEKFRNWILLSYLREILKFSLISRLILNIFLTYSFGYGCTKLNCLLVEKPVHDTVLLYKKKIFKHFISYLSITYLISLKLYWYKQVLKHFTKGCFIDLRTRILVILPEYSWSKPHFLNYI